MDSVLVIAGNITRDPELRFTTSGRAVASFGVAVNRRFQRNGEWEESVSFVNVVAWGDLGDHAAASLRKGDRVLVTGRYDQRTYEDKEGGKRSSVELVATDMGPSIRWSNAQPERISRRTDERASAESTSADVVPV